LDAATAPLSEAKSWRRTVNVLALPLYRARRPSGIAAIIDPPLGAAVSVVLTWMSFFHGPRLGRGEAVCAAQSTASIVWADPATRDAVRMARAEAAIERG